MTACKSKLTKLKPISGTTIQNLQYPLASGHRGAVYIPDYPENCLETFDYLRSKTNLIIECDVAATKDGVLVLMHDKSIDRTTTGTGIIKNKAFASIQDLKLKDEFGNTTDFKIPRFDSILKWAKKTQTILSVDIKGHENEKAIIEALQKEEMKNYSILIAYSLDQAQRLYRMAPDFYQSVSIRNMEEWKRWKNNHQLAPAHQTFAFTGTKRSPKALYDTLHHYGIKTIFGTMGNIDRQAKKKGNIVYQELIENGVDVIATDYPLRIKIKM